VRTALGVLAAGLALLAAAMSEARGARALETAWFDDGARDGAARAAELFASLSAHLRSSGGDPRFTDRIAADPPVVAELLADIAFAQHRGQVERAQLVRCDVRSVKPVGLDLAEVRAKEYWVTRREGAAGPSTRSDVVAVRYAMRRDGGGWRVADWVVDQDPTDLPGPAR
jgi:hypothetical protein